MSLACFPYSCLVELECNRIVHMCTESQSESLCMLLGMHSHTLAAFMILGGSSVARFSHETHMALNKISGTNKDDRKHCSWPTFSHPHDCDGITAHEKTVKWFICLDKIIRRF